MREQMEEHTAQERRLVLDCAMQAGSILLKNGAEIFRVEETVARMCSHYGVESEKAFVLSNGIFLTAGNGNEPFYAKVQHIPVSGARLDRVAAVNQLSREIEEGRYSPQEVKQKLDEIERMRWEAAVSAVCLEEACWTALALFSPASFCMLMC